MDAKTVAAPIDGDTVENWLDRMTDTEMAMLALVVSNAQLTRVVNRPTGSFEERLRKLRAIDPNDKVCGNVMVLSTRWRDSDIDSSYRYTGTLDFMEFFGQDATFESGTAMAHGDIVHNPKLPVSEGNIFFVNVHPLGKEHPAWPHE